LNENLSNYTGRKIKRCDMRALLNCSNIIFQRYLGFRPVMY
jgi:hypothetical protein